MKILITGICGFAGSTIAAGLMEARSGLKIFGVDNFSRPGSELNRPSLGKLGIDIRHADIRNQHDLAALEPAEWVIDAAATPSVLAGLGPATTSRQVMEHNLGGTINLLEYCKAHRAGFILLSTSRVYSLSALSDIRVEVVNDAYRPAPQHLDGLGASGIAESFSTEAPLSFYGMAKRASEQLALEYGPAFEFPVHINRCGVMAGAGQFGKADQGIFSYWIHSYRARRPISYIGFDGQGYQVRDCLHPRDFVPVLLRQMSATRNATVTNFGGGNPSSMSLRQLTAWCGERFGSHPVGSDTVARPFDVPWLVLDSAKARNLWDWRPQTTVNQILEEIAAHAETAPDWLALSR